MTDLLLLQAKTPAEIDAVLNDLGYQLAVVRSRAEQFAKLAQESAEGRRHQRPDPVKAKFYEEQAEQQRAKAQDLAGRIAPLEAEYVRRGGWTRAFLVQNNGGHVHSSTRCSSCYASTRYAWLTDYSGKSEEEIVWAAGELACTICYPSAPVEALTRVGEIRRPADVERERRDAEKADKAQAKAAAAVIDPASGKQLFKTERAATNAIASGLDSLLWYGDAHPSGQDWVRSIDTTANALAVKLGVDKEHLLAECRARAERKFATTARKLLRELSSQPGGVVVENLVPGLQSWVKQNGVPA